MSGRYARLKKNWCLRGWTNVPTTAANPVQSVVRPLSKSGFYTAESCDGMTDFDSLAFLPVHHALLDTLIEEGIAEECREGSGIDAWQQYRKADNPRLTGIHWCVTGRCNLNCRHCCMEAPAGRYGQLPFEDLARFVEQFERANVLQISLTGGEPFLRRDILDLIDLLARKRFWLSQVYSTGLLVTEDHLRCIRGTGFSPSFQISFDGVGSHDRMRGTQGIEQGTIEAIQRVRGADFPVVVATCVDKANIGRLAETYELMKTLAVKSWRIGPPQMSGNWRGAATALSMAEEAEAYTPLLDRWVEDGKPFHIQLGAFYRGGPAPKEEPANRGMPRPAAPGASLKSRTGSRVPRSSANGAGTPCFKPDDYDCGVCRELPNLLPDGTLLPCPGYVDSTLQERMPNLLRHDLSTVWSGSYLREVADMKKKDLFARNPECAACALFKRCGVGCRASALSETGELLAKDPILCELWKSGYKKRFEARARRMPDLLAKAH